MDALLLKSDLIALQETWLESDEVGEDLTIPQYDLHLNSYGKGKGIAIYFKKDIFKHKTDIKQEHMQLSKFTSSTLDIIILYRSQQGSYQEMRNHLKEMETRNKPQLVIGDFNFCYLDKTFNPIKHFLAHKTFPSS